MNIDRKKALVLLTAVAVAAIMGGIIVNAYSTSNGVQSNDSSGVWFNERMMNETGGRPHGRHCERGFRNDMIEVSEEYKENVTNVAKSDQDVQNLLNDGYNITEVKPIIKTTVDANGNVVTKATSAIVMLEKDTTGRALVWVDLEQAKVTRIEILTRTVIEKP